MEPKRELTKELIAASMKELMLHQPFEKITIRVITEHAGVIRPTFYYHFQDKYEVLEWIVRHELISSARLLMERGLVEEAVHVVFTDIDNDREFYRRAFNITGQNNFVSIMVEQVKQFMMELIQRWGVNSCTGLRMLNNEMICSHCATSFVSMVFYWVTRDREHITVEEITKSFLYLASHSYIQCFTPENSEQTES